VCISVNHNLVNRLQYGSCPSVCLSVCLSVFICLRVPAVLKLQSCPEIVPKFEIVLKSQSSITDVLILTIVVRAQSHFNLLLAALLICLLHMLIHFYVLFLFETVTIMFSCVTLPW